MARLALAPSLSPAAGSQRGRLRWQASAGGPFNDSAVGAGTNQFEYVGTWQQGADAGAYGNDEHYSDEVGAYFNFRFSGTQVRLYTTMDADFGIFEASIDGGAISYHDAYNATRAQQENLYTSAVLAPGPHVLKVAVSGAKNAASSGLKLVADRVDVTP